MTTEYQNPLIEIADAIRQLSKTIATAALLQHDAATEKQDSLDNQIDAAHALTTQLEWLTRIVQERP